MVYYDASQVCLGCFFMHDVKVIAYKSRKLKINKKNYPIRDLDLSVVVVALKHWRYYFYGVHVD